MTGVGLNGHASHNLMDEAKATLARLDLPLHIRGRRSGGQTISVTIQGVSPYIFIGDRLEPIPDGEWVAFEFPSIGTLTAQLECGMGMEVRFRFSRPLSDGEIGVLTNRSTTANGPLLSVSCGVSSIRR
jgi:hypothetical protein